MRTLRPATLASCRCASAGSVALRVIGCRGAMVLIGDGDVIEVDADAGHVRVVEPRANFVPDPRR